MRDPQTGKTTRMGPEGAETFVSLADPSAAPTSDAPLVSEAADLTPLPTGRVKKGT